MVSKKAKTRGQPASLLKGMVKTAPSETRTNEPSSRWNWVKDRIHHLHISHRGNYSVERLAALEAYCRETSFMRVLGVCITFPLPALLTAIVIECIPLKDPSEGWKANYAAFIRYAVGYVAISIGGILQMRQLVPGLYLPMLKVVGIAVGAALCTTCAMVIVASQWVFPVPFGLILIVPSYTVSLLSFFLLGIGWKQLKESPGLVPQLKQQMLIILSQATLAFVYPAFSAVYYSLPELGQNFFVVLLPIIKIAMQNMTAWASTHLEEYMPGITVFSVELFNALYLSKCMQSGSMLTYLVIMGFDVVESVLAFRDMQHETDYVQQLKSKCDLSEPDDNLLHAVVALCEQPGMLTFDQGFSVRIHSPISVQVSRENSMTLERISSMYGHSRISAQGLMKNSVAPLVKDVPRSEETRSPVEAFIGTESEKLSYSQKQKLVQQALKVLFATEYHALVEYVECIIPIIYATYVVVLMQLPNAAYFPETRHMSLHHVDVMAKNILLYACLEILSFIGLHYAIKRKFGFSPAYLLSFVLENQAMEFQGRLMIWYIFVLELTLQHYGEFVALALSLLLWG